MKNENYNNCKISKELYNEAINIMPDGVSSPIRAIKPFPFYVKKSYGSKLYDVDNNEYIDYCMAYGPLILGHSNKHIKEKLISQIENGWIYGTPCEHEVKLAKKIISHYQSIDMIRFVSTGTEATMSSIRLARGFTNRNKIIKINGGFHGSHDSVLVKAGSGAVYNYNQNNNGIPKNIEQNTINIEYNNIENLIDVIHENKYDISCVIIEPILGNIGCILPNDGYLKEVRKVTSENDILLIFDEVITGYRISLGGAQEYYNVKPDITTLGKIIGGGLPIGAFGASKEIMENISPKGSIYQAGTFSGNPLSLCSGLETINYIEENNVYQYLNDIGNTFYNSINDILEDRNLENKYSIESISSMFTIFFGNKPKNYEESLNCNVNKYNQFWNIMIKDNIFFPPSQFETSFLSCSHSKEDLSKTIEIIEKNILKLESTL